MGALLMRGDRIQYHKVICVIYLREGGESPPFPLGRSCYESLATTLIHMLSCPLTLSL